MSPNTSCGISGSFVGSKESVPIEMDDMRWCFRNPYLSFPRALSYILSHCRAVWKGRNS